MCRNLSILTLIIFAFSTACNPSRQTKSPVKQHKTAIVKNTTDKIKNKGQEQIVKRLSFKTISDIDGAIWVEKQGNGVLSLSLHFMYKDTLSVEYSPECWLIDEDIEEVTIES